MGHAKPHGLWYRPPEGQFRRVRVEEKEITGKGLELAAGVVVIRPVAEGCRFLLLRAFRYWDFPKGLVEPGEVPLNAAVREVAEETGIADLSFPWDRDRYETETYNRGRKKAVYFAGRTAQTEVVLPVSAELGCPEHHEYRWVTAAEGRELLGDRVRGALEWARRYAGCPEG